MKKLIVLIFISMMVLLGCEKKTAEPIIHQTENISELSCGKHSIDSLMMALVDALNQSDTIRVRSFFITEAEHNQLLGSEFHVHYPSVTKESLPALWENLSLKTQKGFLKLMGNYAGKNYQFVSVRFSQDDEIYSTFRLHQGTILTLRDSLKNEIEITWLGSVAERNGIFKILSIKG